MTPTVKDVCLFMDEWAPPEWAYSWDRIGLQLGDPGQPVTGILACLSITPKAFATAKRIEANMIVAHHPLLWDPLTTLRTDDPHIRFCLELSKCQTACFAAHTNLDMAPDGVNAALAARLELVHTAPLFYESHVRRVKVVVFVPESHRMPLITALAKTGAGIIGNYSYCSYSSTGIGTFLPNRDAHPYSGMQGKLKQETEWRLEMIVDQGRLSQALSALRMVHPYEEPAYDIIPIENPAPLGLGIMGELTEPMTVQSFSEKVRKSLRLPFIQLYAAEKKVVRHVAVLGGSGGDFCGRIPKEADIFVTGDVGYHDAQLALLRNIACLDAGHAGTELPVVSVLTQKLKKAFPHLKVAGYKESGMVKILSA